MSAPILASKINGVRRQWRLVEVGTGAMRSIIALSVVLLGFFIVDWLAIDRVIQSPGADLTARICLLLIAVGIVFHQVWTRVCRQIVRPLDDDFIAVAIERRYPDLRDRLISTIQLGRDRRTEGASADLIAALEKDTVAYVKPLRFDEVVTYKPLGKSASRAFGAVAIIALLAFWQADFARVLLDRALLGSSQYPTATRIVSVTEGRAVIQGEPFTIDVELDADGYLPDEADVLLQIEDGSESILRLERIGPTDHGTERYTGVIDPVVEAFEYLPRAFDARWNDWQQLEVLQRPTTKGLTLTYRYPAYLGMTSETTTIGDIRAPIGSTVEIVATTNKEVRKAELSLRHQNELLEPVAMTLNEEGTEARAEVPVVASGSYKIQLHCTDGFESAAPIEYLIDAIPDREPRARITFPAEDKTVTRFAHWPIRFEARDDHGIANARLVYQVSSAETVDGEVVEQEPKSIPIRGLTQGKRQTEVDHEFVFDLRTIEVSPQQRITYWIELEDHQTPEPNVGSSQAYTFNVVSAEEMRALLERNRDNILKSLQEIKDRQKETRDKVDEIRREID